MAPAGTVEPITQPAAQPSPMPVAAYPAPAARLSRQTRRSSIAIACPNAATGWTRAGGSPNTRSAKSPTAAASAVRA